MMTKNKFMVRRNRDNGDAKPKDLKTPPAYAENPDYDNQAYNAFEDERSNYLAEKLQFQAQQALADENLPISFAKLLCGSDEEETMDNIAVFKQEFLKAIEAAISEKLRGCTPRTASGSIEYDPFLRGLGY
jgi:hypothetical protein